MKTQTKQQLVGDLRERAAELELRAQHLRETADFLTDEYHLDGESDGQPPAAAPEPPALKAKKPGAKGELVSCPGCPQNTDCTNQVKSLRRGKPPRCEECKRLVSAARQRLIRANKKSQSDPKTKTVWHGGEGLSAAGPSSLSDT